VAALRTLVARDPAIVTRMSRGHNRTLLWEATRRGHRSAVEYLVAAGADVNVPGRYRHETLVLVSPYVLAHLRGDDGLAHYLASQGATLDLYRAAFLGDEEPFRAALVADPTLLNAEDPADSIWYVPPLG
jgi:hypothetical protein